MVIVKSQKNKNQIHEELYSAVSKPHNEFNQQQEEIILSIIVEPGRVECFYQPIINLKHAAFEMDYQV